MPPPNRFHVDKIFVRSVGETFHACVREDPRVPIDVDRAKAQHAAYVDALCEAVGPERVVSVPADNRFPDGVFVEDTAVVLDHKTVLATRPGATSRRGEVASVSSALKECATVVQLDAPACIDGGDVLRVGGHLFIGLSSRTNRQGAERLEKAANDTGVNAVTLNVPRGLHLKSAISLATPSLALFDPQADLDLTPFETIGLECVPAPEPLGANVLALAEDRVLVSEGAPRTEALLKARGIHVWRLDVSEFHKADGALTCPSIRVPSSSSWCT